MFPVVQNLPLNLQKSYTSAGKALELATKIRVVKMKIDFLPRSGRVALSCKDLPRPISR